MAELPEGGREFFQDAHHLHAVDGGKAGLVRFRPGFVEQPGEQSQAVPVDLDQAPPVGSQIPVVVVVLDAGDGPRPIMDHASVQGGGVVEVRDVETADSV